MALDIEAINFEPWYPRIGAAAKLFAALNWQASS